MFRALRDLASELYPGGRVGKIRLLAPDTDDTADPTHKGIGYGDPIRLTVTDADSRSHDLVLHTATANDFGHDRRSDRAAEMLLGFDTFAQIPRHTRAIDVGAVGPTGALVSLRDCGEFYLLTEFIEGELYAEELRRVARTTAATDEQVERARVLGRYLASLHQRSDAPQQRYARAIRDLVGSGEGIFGIIDGYPADVAGAPVSRLRAMEQRCADWRWRLRDRTDRLSRTHGDFHPFNILFDGDDLALLDASRGCLGEPADDVTCLTLNYVFFALEVPAAWESGLGRLWRAAWDSYLTTSGDQAILETAPPFLAWRALVLANPQWYPGLAPATRDALLGLAERCLDEGHLDPAFADQLFP